MGAISTRFAIIIATSTIVATTIAPSAPIGAQGDQCDGRAASAGVTSERDPDTFVNRITGTSGRDVIVGTDGPDIIFGLSGQDIICGLGGNDIIYGGIGADRIFGQKGSDRIFGGSGNDTLIGGRGHDTIRSGAGDDTVRGGRGDDVIDGNVESPASVPDASSGPQPAALAFSIACTQTDLVNYYQSQIGTESETLDDAEERLFDLVNDTRSICDLGPLVSMPEAEAFAQQHTNDMQMHRLNGSGSFTEAPDHPWFGHSDLWARIAQDDPTDDIVRAGENVAFVSQGIDPVLVHVNLLRSGAHMCNIVDPGYDSMGLGFSYFEPGSETMDPRGNIVAQIYAGDTNVQATSGQLIVQDTFGVDNTDAFDCWN